MVTKFILVILFVSKFANSFEFSCPKDCDERRCRESASKCLLPPVKDRCGCCYVCGESEGQRCFNETLIETVGKSMMDYNPCSDGLECLLRTDLDLSDAPEAICVCSHQPKVCGSDDKTYDNICQLTHERYKRRGESVLIQKSRGPCPSPPEITRGPKDTTTILGNSTAFECEVIGYPVPDIHWTFFSSVNHDLRDLPSDEPNLSVQTRGGPAQAEITGWLQIQSVGPSDTGIYTCIATNTGGKSLASAKLFVL